MYKPKVCLNLSRVVTVEVAGACMYVMNILQHDPCSHGAMKPGACKLIKAKELKAVCACYFGRL